MTDQGALVHDPDRSGLWRRVLLPGGDVHNAAWHDAINTDSTHGRYR